MKFADVILPIAISKPLTYGIPIELQGLVEIGMRVEVPFGKNKKVSGIVYHLHNEKPEAFQIRPVIKCIDERPILSREMLQFWEWISAYYCCSLGEIMQAALPAFLKLSYENVLAWNMEFESVPEELNDDAYALAEFVFRKKEVKISEIQNLKFYHKIASSIDTLLSYQLIEIKESTESSYKPKIEKFISLDMYDGDDDALRATLDALHKAPKMEKTFLKLLQLKKQLAYTSVKELVKNFSFNTTYIRNLEKKGCIKITEKTVDRIQLNSDNFNTKEVQLSKKQKEVKDAILQHWNEKLVVLLKGVTGSGKTMVYIELIKECIRKNQQVLLLLPEIALTQHIISRLEPYFGEELGVYHSKYSNNERVEIWNKVQSSTYKVIVGARSSIWLPFQNLGLIIVDEEHDSSFKQKDPAPRFQARDSAIRYAAILGAKVLLGSATPSFDTFYNVKIGKYAYVELNEKFNDVAPSDFEIVNNNNTLSSLSNIIAYPILMKIEEAIQQNKQVIVFQNRRGYAPVIFCNDCQTVSKCTQCDVSLTYHKRTHRLHCHYCGQTYTVLTNCSTCGSSNLSIKGFGTEKLEEELSRIFSKYKISRLDLDSIKGKNAHYEVINEFEKGFSQILVGTQMVVKGLDFENVGLVVILNADALLYYPDYRVQERAFQLLVQVAGRAGRKHHAGKILIQSSNTQHPIYNYVRNNDYNGLFQEEMFIRKALLYPPFCRLIQIFVRHIQEEKSREGIEILKQKIDSKNLPILINGPSPSLVKKVKNKFIYELLLKCPMNSKELDFIKEKISESIAELKSQRGFSTLQIQVDIDPNS